ncbi:hypothetical protein C0081_12190 [Cohaesibacter celericrescens]|uniref:Uncharacterized protein n=1 Tax=Cohaesibacter celericrescens TaxID=2067669 RepID=A0A2N5XQN2_9HYPH|nr:hypothetical protein C0081_12190 [Cohaesibacter celericrescens]
MQQTLEPIDASTLGHMIDNGDQLYIVCMNGPCSHGAEIIVAWLVDLLGRNHSSLERDLISGLKRHHRRFRCKRCNGYKISFRRVSGCYTGYASLNTK